MADQTVASKFAEKLLVGTLEAIVRAGAKAAESIASDAKKALRNEALKVEMIEKGVEHWRQTRLGEVDDLPSSLRDESKNVQ
jgi:hypothetical protein